MGLSISYVQSPERSRTIIATISGNNPSVSSTISWGDNTSDQLNPGVVTASHTYSGNGPYTMIVIQDNNRFDRMVYLYDTIVTTLNIAGNPLAINTEVYNYQDDMAYTWNWGDGTPTYTLAKKGAPTGSQPGAVHAYMNNYKPYTVTVTSGTKNWTNKVVLPSTLKVWFNSSTNPTICYFQISSPYLSNDYTGSLLQYGCRFGMQGSTSMTSGSSTTRLGFVNGNFVVRLSDIQGGLFPSIIIWRDNTKTSVLASIQSVVSTTIPTPYPTSFNNSFTLSF